ncbi:hypothetical protein C8C76_1654 [Halanaerobium saccharolyticum]|jgi:hypothetical protein|uniref:Uncharacterized protein n=1 Tax=Halanaerobium saccharolyticum TaxID=43595 RepID=A0A2T5RF23_9FIRM|nr:hypothetical protein C8C76_1654 [Halanaerobium saccharolyticum]
MRFWISYMIELLEGIILIGKGVCKGTKMLSQGVLSFIKNNQN